jgi:NADH-quinone oxidoreductase subunit L
MVAAMGTVRSVRPCFICSRTHFFQGRSVLSAGAVIHGVREHAGNGGLADKVPSRFGCTPCRRGTGVPAVVLHRQEAILGCLCLGRPQSSHAEWGLILLPVLLLLSSGLTALYMARQWRLVFSDNRVHDASVHRSRRAHDE